MVSVRCAGWYYHILCESRHATMGKGCVPTLVSWGVGQDKEEKRVIRVSGSGFYCGAGPEWGPGHPMVGRDCYNISTHCIRPSVRRIGLGSNIAFGCP